MATYTATVTAVATDPQKQNSNLYVTVEFLNNSTQDKQSRTYISDTVTLAALQTWGLAIITALKARDTAVANITAAIGTAQAVLGTA